MQMEFKKTDVEKELKENKEKIRKLNDEIYEKNFQISRQTAEINNLRERIAQRDEKKRKSLERLQNQSQLFPNVELRSKDDSKHHEKNVKVEENERKINELQNELQKLKSIVEERDLKIVQLEEEKQNLENSNRDAAEEKNTTFENEMGEMKRDLQEKCNEIEKLKAEISVKEISYQQQLDAKDEEINHLSKTVDQLNNKMQINNEAFMKLKSEIENLSGNLIMQSATTSNTISYKQKEIEEQKNLVKNLTLQLDKRNVEIENLKQAIEENKKARNETEQLKLDLSTKENYYMQQIGARDKKMKELSETVDQLNRELVKNTKPAVNEMGDEIKTLKIQLDKKNAEIENLKKAQNEIELLKRNHHDKEEFYKQQISIKDETIAELSKTVADMNRELLENKRQEELQERENEIENLTQGLNVAHRQSEIEAQKIQDLETLQQTLQRKYDELSSENQLLLIQIAELQSMASNEKETTREDEEQIPVSDPTAEEIRVAECLKKIQEIQVNSTKLNDEVQEFQGVATDRQFLHLEEMLIRNLVKLDNVESEGNGDIRKERKAVLQFVQRIIEDLNKKVNK